MHHLNKWIVQRRSSVRKREGLSTSEAAEAAAAVSAIEAEPLLLPSLAVASYSPIPFFTLQKNSILEKNEEKSTSCLSLCYAKSTLYTRWLNRYWLRLILKHSVSKRKPYNNKAPSTKAIEQSCDDEMTNETECFRIQMVAYEPTQYII